jgi:hypothetical protein
MSSSPPPNSPTTPLAAFASFIGIMSIFLYYSGWIYRWAYFDSFAVDVRALNFSAESFLLVTIQVFLGDPFRIFQLFILIVFNAILIKSILLLSQVKPLRRVINTLIPDDLFKDLVIVACVLTSLFIFSSQQGIKDAGRDAISSTSTRPSVTIVGAATKLPIGRNPKDSSTDSSLKETHFIGDKDELDKIIPIDYDNPDVKRSWRLLAENANWVYVFPAQDGDPGKFPPVLAINTGDGRIQLLIVKYIGQKSNQNIGRNGK